MSVVIDGTTGIDTIEADIIPTALNATGTAPLYACRAWVNFDGTGTVAIRASGNVSGITDNGTGDYTVNFTTAMPDASYAANVTRSGPANASSIRWAVIIEGSYTTSSVGVVTAFDNTLVDISEINVSIFR